MSKTRTLSTNHKHLYNNILLVHVMCVGSAVYREPDIIHASGRKAFHIVKETGGKDTPNPKYEIVATSRAMPAVSPSTPHTHITTHC